MRALAEDDQNFLLEIAGGFRAVMRYMNEESRALYTARAERLEQIANREVVIQVDMVSPYREEPHAE
jgi:hypothetical protein